MRYNANVTKCAARPEEVAHFHVGLIDASSPDEAARYAAQRAVKQFYPVTGSEVSSFQRHGDKYLCSAGLYRLDSGYGVTKGATLSIRVHPVGDAT